jgi:site-specific DNA-methyltransferase (adenine-specific)
MIVSDKPRIELLNVDCMEYMATVPDKHFDLAIVDPPYGISQPAFRKESKNKATLPKNYNNTVFKQKAPDQNYFNELFRVSKNQIVWGGNYYNTHLAAGKKWIFWDKGTEDTQWGDGELAWTSFHGAITKFEFTWNGMIQGDMKNKEERIHPTQKPVKLYRWLLKNYAKEGDKILDTHGGSLQEQGFVLLDSQIPERKFSGSKFRLG